MICQSNFCSLFFHFFLLLFFSCFLVTQIHPNQIPHPTLPPFHYSYILIIFFIIIITYTESIHYSLPHLHIQTTKKFVHLLPHIYQIISDVIHLIGTLKPSCAPPELLTDTYFCFSTDQDIINIDMYTVYTYIYTCGFSYN